MFDNQEPEQISYEEEFEELRCIGRGNFGAAWLVKLRNTPDDSEHYFIAKKIILGQLTEKEQEGAYLEVRTFHNLSFRLNYSKSWTIQISFLIDIHFLRTGF